MSKKVWDFVGFASIHSLHSFIGLKSLHYPRNQPEGSSGLIATRLSTLSCDFRYNFPLITLIYQ